MHLFRANHRSPFRLVPRQASLLTLVGGVLAVAASLVSSYALSEGMNWKMLLALVAALDLAIVGLQRPLLFLSVFLLIRPLLDQLEGHRTRLAGSASINSAGVVALLLLAIALLILAGIRRVVWPRATKAFVAVLLVSAFAAAHSLLDLRQSAGSAAIGEVARLATLAAIYVLAVNLCDTPAKVRRLFVVVGVSGLLPALVGVYQWLHGIPLAADLSIGRVFGTFSGPNAFGEFLALIALLLLSIPRDALPRWLWLGSLVAVLAALVGTFSRTGWVMLALGLVLLGWRRKRVLVAGAAVCIVLVSAVPSVRARLVDKTSVSATSTTVRIPSSYRWRIDTWKALLGKYEESPLTGFGLRSAPFVDPRQLVLPNGQPPTGYDPHNTVVKLLVEGGPVLLAAWAALFFAVLNGLRKLTRIGSELQPLARTMLMLWVVIAVIGITSDDPLAATAMLYGVFALTGAVESAARAGPRPPSALSASAR